MVIPSVYTAIMPHSTVVVVTSERTRRMLTTGRYDRLSMALELAKHNPVYEDIASKFFEVSEALSSFIEKM